MDLLGLEWPLHPRRYTSQGVFVVLYCKMDEERIEQLGKLKFVKQMGKLSNKSFSEVYKNNPLFVEFTRESMASGKGIFKFWIDYCKLLKNTTHAKPVQKPAE